MSKIDELNLVLLELNLKLIEPYTKAKVKTQFQCFCGKIFLARPDSIKRKMIRSCGCLRSKCVSERRLIKLKIGRKFDKFVRKLTGGLTILSPAKGSWVFNNTLFEERVIPVKISCTRKQLDNIVEFTLRHYRQKCVMAYKISNEIILKYGEGYEI